MKNSLKLLTLMAALSVQATAVAEGTQDDSNLVCKSADKLAETIQSVYSQPKDLVNVITAKPELSIKSTSGSPLTSALFVKSTKTGDSIPLQIDNEGHVTNLKDLAVLKMPVESCRQKDLTEDKIELSFRIDIQYKNTSGTYSLAELAEGVDDGTKVLKSMAPALMRMMVPDYESILVTSKPDSPAPQLQFMKDGSDVEVPVHTLMSKGQYVLIKDMKAAGVDTVKVSPPTEVTPFFGQDTINKYQAKLAKEKTKSGG